MSNFSINFTYPWLLLLLIPAAVFTIIPYLRITKKYRRNRNRVVSIALHSLIMVVCIFLLAGMTFSYTVPNKENEIILLVDSSFSNEEAIDQKEEFIQTVVNDSGNNYKIGIVKFGYTQEYVAPLSTDAKHVYRQYLGSDDPDTTATDIAGALRYASTLFSNPKAAKIVLLSDGLQTDNNATTVIKAIAAEGIKVDTVYFGNQTHDEVQIIGVETPDYNIDIGADFNIDLTVCGNIADDSESIEVTIYDNDEASEPTKEKLNSGLQTITLTHSFDVPGMHQLRFEITNSKDTVLQNNVYYSYININIYGNILVIENDKAGADQLDAMFGDTYTLTSLNVKSDINLIPADIETLCGYDQVILVNIANSDMPLGFDILLSEYVYEYGGGLLTVGGTNDEGSDGSVVPHAYNRDDMYATLYQQMLPVQVVEYTPPIAVMIVIDHSGSMSDSVEFAKQGALSVLDALSARDYCGIMTFDDTNAEAVKIYPVSQRELIKEQINSIDSEAAGGTVFSGPIISAGLALSTLNVEKKHIIIITDGMPADSLEDDGSSEAGSFGQFIDDNTKNGITMSIVQIGGINDTYQTMMEGAAKRGNGVFYHVSESKDLANIVYKDLVTQAIAEIGYGKEFTPKINEYNAIVSGIEQGDMPKLTGYYGTVKKEEATVVLTGDYSVPIYAQWTYGAGKVGSFMCDINGTWSADFVSSAVGQRLFENVIEALFPTNPIQISDIIVTTKEDNYSTQLNVYTSLQEDDTVELAITPLTDSAISYYANSGIPISVADGYTRFTFTITQPGLYQIVVSKKDVSGNVLSEYSFYKTFSYSDEYNIFTDEEVDGEQLLAKIAEDGRGVVVADSLDIFESFAKTIDKTFDPRLIFLIVSMVCFLLDVAVRKFKFKWIHELIRERKQNKSLNTH